MHPTCTDSAKRGVTQSRTAVSMAVAPAAEIRLFGKYSFDDVEVKDISLEDYIAVKPKFAVYVPHTAGRYQKKRFRKAQCPIVERLVLSLMMHGRNNGKKLMAVRIVKHAFEIINLLTDQNPIQVLVDAIINSGPREDATRIGSAGVVRRQAVDISPLRRVNQAIWLLCTGAREASFRNIKTIAECLADELTNAAKGSSNRSAEKEAVARFLVYETLEPEGCHPSPRTTTDLLWSVCAANCNRSMAAHELVAQHGFRVSSFGVGSQVKLPGPSAQQHNIYSFGTPYATIHADLTRKDPELYLRNGLLPMMARNARIKKAPQRWQDNRAPFDVVVTFEERIMEVVLEDMEGRQAASRSLIPVSYSQLSQHGQAAVESVGAGAGFRPCLVVNLDVKDSTDEAALAAPQALKLCSMIAAFAKGKDGCWEAGVEAVLDTFHKETGRRPIYGVCWPAVKRAGTDTTAIPKKCKLHTLMTGVSAAGLERGRVVASEVVEARLVTQIEAWVKACSMRALLASLLFGHMVRSFFTRVTVLPDGQEAFEDIPALDAVIPNLADRNLFLQLGRGLPPPGRQSRPSEAVEDVLTAYPDLHASLDAVPRYPHDRGSVDDVGRKLETNFANSLTELFLRRLEQAVALAGARVIAGSHEHQRRLGLPLGGSPAWTERQRSWVVRSVQGKEVTWLQGAGGVVPSPAMREEVARQRRLLGLRQGVVVNEAWLERKVNRGRLLRHAVDTSRQLEAAHVSWQADWADWQAAGGQRNTRPYRPPSPFAITPGCSCKAHHIKLDTEAIYGLMQAAGMLPRDITSLPKFRNGVAGPKDSEVANRWNAFLPNLASLHPNRGQTFAQVVHTDGVAVSVLFTRPIPEEQPDKLPSMGKEEGAVNPLAHLDADWLGCDPGKTNMATVAHEERYPSGAVKSVWQRSLTAGQYYRQSGITEHAKVSKVWMAGIKPQHDELSQVTNYTVSLQRYQQYAATVLATWPAMWAELSKTRWSNARFRLYGGKQRTVAKFWAETAKGAMVRCNSAPTGRPLALAYGAAGFSGSGSIGSKGVPVKQMLREACKQFPGRVVLVHEFRTSRVSSAQLVAAPSAQHGDAVPDQLNVIKRRFYDRDVSAALNIARIAAGPGRPRELSSWLGRPAMPNPGRPGQEWVDVRDKGLLRKWQRRHQRQRQQLAAAPKALTPSPPASFGGAHQLWLCQRAGQQLGALWQLPTGYLSSACMSFSTYLAQMDCGTTAAAVAAAGASAVAAAHQQQAHQQQAHQQQALQSGK
ncbi:hypothetical protein QJQ45_020875 [Haematococcus lacustris]|nr:hypothetical protein QJQ45_020875 [Haematococcus lacustris]